MKTTKKKLRIFLEMTSFDPKSILKELKAKKITDVETLNKLLFIACSRLVDLSKRDQEIQGAVIIEEDSLTQ